MRNSKYYFDSNVTSTLIKCKITSNTFKNLKKYTTFHLSHTDLNIPLKWCVYFEAGKFNHRINLFTKIKKLNRYYAPNISTVQIETGSTIKRRNRPHETGAKSWEKKKTSSQDIRTLNQITLRTEHAYVSI